MVSEQFVHIDPTLNDVEIAIIRESGWLNRYCQNLEDNEILFYCEGTQSSGLTIHHGNKSGPIIATTRKCFLSPKATDIHLNNPHSTIQVKHICSKRFPSKTQFNVNGTKYLWVGESELIESKTGAVIAQFYPSWNTMDSSEHKLGKLVIKEKEKELMDLAVITALIMGDYSEEGKKAAKLARKSSRGKESRLFRS